MHATKIISGLLLVGLLTPTLLADDTKPTQSDPDHRIIKIAYEITSLGTDLYNKGNHEGCQRLYQGSLMALIPMLESRPTLQISALEKFDKARKMSLTKESAFAMREILDTIRTELEGPAQKTADPGKKPLWDRLGGEPAVRTVTKEFLTAAAKDPKVNVDRNGNYPLTKDRVERLEQLVVEYISSISGGPLKYSGRDMKNAHLGMKITEAEFNAAAGHLIAVMKKLNVPQPEIDEFVGAVAGTMKDIVEKK